MGERFAGRYELVDHLGEGGGGSVWRAWDARRERYVAAKLLRQRDASALLRFVREQSLRVAHPHVVAPTGWAAEDDDVLLTMDLLCGGSVATLLADYGRLPAATVAVLLDQLLDALAAVHAAGLVHRDVTPANLLLEPTGTDPPFLRLADFGIAVLRSDPRLTATGYVMGTTGYVAPEVMLGADPDPRQDLWAVGVVGLQALSGAGEPEAGAGLLGWLRTLADPDPDRRYDDASTARAELRGITVPAVDQADPVEVLDHLAVLPEGWTPQGPATRGSAGRPVAAGTRPRGLRELPARPAPTAALAAGRRGTARTTRPSAVAAVGGSGADRSGSGHPGRQARRRLVLCGSAAAVLVLLAAVAFSRALPVAGQGVLRAPGGVPATTARPGDACPFSDVGLSGSSRGELVTCRLQDGAYRWTRG